jgi:hypothetical protein
MRGDPNSDEDLNAIQLYINVLIEYVRGFWPRSRVSVSQLILV